MINGPVRNELGFNMGIGALGPFNEASAVIGRSWTFITKNLGGGGKRGTTYLGTMGTNFNYNNICFAEKEEVLPDGWKPFHVQKGFDQDESIVSVFNGWTLLNYSAAFAVAFLLSLYLQYTKGFSPQNAGLILVTMPAVQASLSPLAGRLSDRIEPKHVSEAIQYRTLDRGLV